MHVSRKLVIKKVSQIFPKKDRKRIMNILDLYGVGRYEPARDRVQLAVLKLCEGREENVHKLVALAKIDYCEDILWPAEEPNLTVIADNMPNMSEEEIRELQEKDRKQYLDWLKE